MHLACLQSATAAEPAAAKSATTQAGVALQAHFYVSLSIDTLTTAAV